MHRCLSGERARTNNTAIARIETDDPPDTIAAGPIAINRAVALKGPNATVAATVDGVWAELQAQGNGAIDNEGETRSKLASMVIDLAHAPELNAELAKQEILQKLPGRSRPVSDALFS